MTEWTNYICQSKPLDPAISSIIKKEYFVLRNRSILQKLKLIQSFMELPKNRERRINSTEKNESINWKEIFLSDYFMSLVPVSLRMTSHGKCPQFAMICKPFDSELQRTELKSRTLGPCEPRHADTLRQARLDFTNGKRKLNKSIQSNELLESEIHRKLLGNEEQEFENLYLPTSKTILNSCSRPIMGYVKKGGFSLSEARVTGFGFVSYASLVSFLKESYDKNQKPVVLIRAPHSCQYYFADFSVMS